MTRARRAALWAGIAAVLVLVCAGCGQAPGLASRISRFPPGRAYPAPPAGGALESIACHEDNDCWAVGHAAAGGGRSRPVIERYDLTGWRLVAVPGAGGSAALFDVTCIGAAECWAVGGMQAGGASQPLIEHFAQSAWSRVTPAPTAGVVLHAVACVRSGECWAVGSSGTSSPRAAIERLSAGRWAPMEGATVASGGGRALLDLACPAAADCWAVGYSTPQGALIEHYDGVSWTVAPSPEPSASDSRLAAVTCSFDGDCWAVGRYRAHGGDAPLIEQYTDGRWRIVPSPVSVFGVGAQLNDAACFADTNCWAVGSSRSPSGAESTLVEQYGGDGWGIVRSPALGAGASAALQGVACPSSDDCWTAGHCSAAAAQSCGGSPSLVELYDTILPDGH